MKSLSKSLKVIAKEHRPLMFLMLLLFLMGVSLFIFSLVTLKTGSSVVKIGYGDIGGYRDGSWLDMLTFPLLSLIFAILHNFLAVRIFEKRGDGSAKAFILISIILVIGTFIVLLRLLGEG